MVRDLFRHHFINQAVAGELIENMRHRPVQPSPTKLITVSVDFGGQGSTTNAVSSLEKQGLVTWNQSGQPRAPQGFY
jgi:hypothetical protein